MTAEIRAAIGVEGAIPFERYMELALYGRDGFYMREGGGSAGRRGDFITSPEVGPLFGAVLARFIDGEWKRLGRPEPFTVIEVGAGPGTLARSVALAAPACATAMRYVAIEVSPAQRRRHPEVVISFASLHDAIDEAATDGVPLDGVVIANELLDNLPFRLAVFDDGWREAFVGRDPSGRYVEVLPVPIEPVPDMLHVRAALGARVPLIDRAAAWVEDARSLLRSGSVVAIDYGVAHTAELAARPWRDWLRTYRDHERGRHYLAEPGSQDITTDVPFDQLPEPDAVRTQAQFLQRWGIEELVAEGKRIWAEQAARPGLEAMRMRSRVSESEALLDPAGLGAFLVTEWRAG